MNPTASVKNRHRKISPFEWIYLSAARHFPPLAIQLWIEAESLPARAELENALAVAATANPGARLVPAGGWWVDSGKTPCIRNIPGSEPFSLTHPCLHAAFSFKDAPPIEIVCWPGTGLIFRCSHALMDAGGLVFFAEETFRALRGEPLLGTCTGISDHDYLAGLGHPRSRPLLSPDKKSPLGDPTPGKAGFLQARRTIPGQVSAVSARLACALEKMHLHPDCSGRILLPVDLRQVDASLRSTCNFSNALFLELPASSAWTAYHCRILELLGRHDERAVSRLDALLRWIPAPLLGAGIQRLHDHQVKHDRYLFSATVSHIGSVSLRAFSAQGFTPKAIVPLPFDAPGSAVTLVSIQHENGLELAASCPSAAGSDGRLERALDALRAELEQGKHSLPVPPVPDIRYSPAEGPQTPLPADLTAYGLFARQANAFEARTAVSEGGKMLSYGELERLSLRCAGQLRNHGVKPGDNVAILCGRRLETIIALLGILRLGAAFVPLDPEWPAERIRFVLEDCKPACLVMDEQHEGLADFSPCLPLSELSAAGAAPSDVVFDTSPESPAYVLYTSGSTGKPKGVVVGQRSLINYVLWARDAYLAELDAPAVFPFFTSLAFDLTLTSLFLPLASGGEIRVFAQRDPLQAMHAILRDPAVNAVKLTPSHLRLFSASGIEKSGLHTFVVGGEALPVKLAEEIHAQSSGRARIFNEYGPTEATIGCVVHRFEPGCDADAFVPIGDPIMNTEVLLLDGYSRLVADGEAGEIYLSGGCLALGYIGRPEETARFSPHPFRAGARVYRTGDRARRLPNGGFDYRGRSDEQIKVLGHRVEPGEIEAAIEASGYCRNVAVVPEETANGTRLAAFVTWRGDACEADLRAALATLLPGYMVPARITGLDHMPLNVNGKVDKTRLPVVRQPVRSEAVSALGEMEAALSGIVLDLIGAEADRHVFQDESLLALGLDSLQMMLLVTLAVRRFLPDSGRDIPFSTLETFFHEPTLQNLAKHLRNWMGKSS